MIKKQISILIIGLAMIFGATQIANAGLFDWLFQKSQEPMQEQTFGGTILKVPAGGTGAISFTAGECLVGAGTGAITTTACGTGGGTTINQLGQIGDVSTSTPMTYGEMLIYNTATSEWESVATSTLGISASFTATYPITLTGTAFGLGFGTTSSNTWAGTQTFTNAPVLTSLATAAGTFLAVDANGQIISTTTPSGGSSTFLGLTDTPDTYSGQGSKFVKVNSGETALEFVDTGLFEIDISGALQPSDLTLTDNRFELDGNNNIQPL